MKGDFSRLTFQPHQHYVRVLQQQGRPQLDADWNEQIAILLHRLETLTGDLTGGGRSRSGAPVGMAGFEIGPVVGETDNFTIGSGRYYVDGLCCECDHDTTYATQWLPTGTKPDPDGISLVYLDAWEAVVTPLDDPELLEPALDGLETTLRTRIFWQVRTERLSQHHDPRAPDFSTLQTEAHERTGGWRSQPRGLLRVRLSGPPAETGRRSAGAASGHFRGPENLLYRIEVHEGGRAGQATFKWSRENGAPLLPLLSLDGHEARVAPVARQTAAHLTPGTWVELSDSHDRALGRSRNMTTLVSVDAASGRIVLHEAPADGLNLEPGGRADIALRRWDQLSHPGSHGAEAGPKGVPIIEGEHEAHWLDIEDGIQVQFQAAPEHHHHHYRTGDYWLAPARTADEGRLLRGPAAQPPDGVEHHYAPLGLFMPQLALVLPNFRATFQPLTTLNDLVITLLEQVNTLSNDVKDLQSQIALLRRA